jgi:hypothetical protein
MMEIDAKPLSMSTESTRAQVLLLIVSDSFEREDRHPDWLIKTRLVESPGLLAWLIVVSDPVDPQESVIAIEIKTR